MLYFKLYSFTLLQLFRSFAFLFMYLGELLQYYQSSNNLPQSAQTLDFDLKSCFVMLNTSSRSTLTLQTCLRLNLCRFGLLNTSELICSWLTCLDSLFQPFVLCVETSTLSACCSVVSGGYLNTLTFVGLVLVSSCFIHPSF